MQFFIHVVIPFLTYVTLMSISILILWPYPHITFLLLGWQLWFKIMSLYAWQDILKAARNHDFIEVKAIATRQFPRILCKFYGVKK